jgi:two-component system, NarL family, response regulator NreC
MSAIRILLADDHTVIRSGLRALLERVVDFQVVAESGDGWEAANLVDEHHPHVAVMDIAMPRLNGIEATHQITSKHPEIAVVILSMHSDEGYVLRSLKAGARAYLLKDSAEAELISAIRAVHQSKAFFSPTISKMLAEDYVRQIQQRGAHDSFELLSAREREVLQLLAEGRSNKDVAALLNLSLYTIETHRSNILQKLGLHSSAELILYAVRKGIVS